MVYVLLDSAKEWLAQHGVYALLQVLDWATFRALAALATAFFVVVLLGRPFARFLAARGVGDQAQFDVEALDRAMADRKGTPTMGGALVAAAMLLATLLFADIRANLVHLALTTIVWMACVGGADDWLKLTAASRGEGSRQGLYAWEKLVFQLGLGALVGVFLWRAGDATAGPDLQHVLNLPFQRTYDPATRQVSQSLLYLPLPLFAILSALMVAGMSNAVNVTDGMDGLASGITTFVALGMLPLCVVAGWEVGARYLLVPYIPGAGELAVVCGAMAGACLGFLWWNCSPALMFMGDTGALCLGGLLGFVAMAIRQEILMLLMSGVLLVELGSVALQTTWYRLSGGRRVFRCAPYHWHLQMGGWPEQKVVVRLWIVTLMLTVLALATIKVR